MMVSLSVWGRDVEPKSGYQRTATGRGLPTGRAYPRISSKRDFFQRFPFPHRQELFFLAVPGAPFYN